jgi:hypothetical protein
MEVRMATRLALFTAFIVVCVLAVPAWALDYPCADNQTSCGSFDIDQEPGATTGGSSTQDWAGMRVTSCNAYKSHNEKCLSVVWTLSGSRICGYVTWDGVCACNKVTYATYGSCFYSLH